MKRFLLISSLLFAVFENGVCQVRWGIKTGLNVSTAQFNQFAFSTQAKAGLAVGALAEITVHRRFFIRPELLYSVKGYRYSSAGAGDPTTVQLQYFSLPLLAGYRPMDKLSVLIGPELNFLARSEGEQNGRKTNGFPHRRWDWGLQAGIAYQVLPQLGVEMRYGYSFSPLLNLSALDPDGNEREPIQDGYNRSLQVSVYYLLKKK